ncbi:MULTISPECIES: hypothetical protein [unclassified Modestobacter]|uniref:hypothetical protein n=1 Tax=unclassified Modestobacter TaxID=2643866 RepID=UPI0022AAF6F0|nr:MULTISPECIES: hypothetical protein [unclassified Modestobacter]MCZ2826786.1 hypothetical protein [Modestobacter sp. VKM Ac-2981]MCZ2855166.1 hypothetical protein [Modestobacter sp. VKM Ac-2982]
MTRYPRRLPSGPVPGWRRRALPLGVVLLASAALVGCGQDPDQPQPEVTAEELEDVRDEVSALERRVEALEADGATEPTADPGAPAPETSPPAEATPQFTEGEDVSVRAEVVGLIATTDIGTAFRVSTGSGRAVAVVSATPVQPLQVQDVVRVSGTATAVDRETFEREFGIAPTVIFDDPEAFFAGEDGQIAIAADQVEPLDGAAVD